MIQKIEKLICIPLYMRQNIYILYIYLLFIMSVFSFQDYPEFFFEYEAPPLTIAKVVTLKNFIKHLKYRLSTIEEEWSYNGCCSKLVTRSRYGYGPPTTYRCGGSLESYGCFNCDNTGIECAGECGNCVTEAGKFCSWSCKGEYFKDVIRDRRDSGYYRENRYYD